MQLSAVCRGVTEVSDGTERNASGVHGNIQVRASGASPNLPRRVLVWLAMLARPPIDDSANDDADDSDY